MDTTIDNDSGTIPVKESSTDLRDLYIELYTGKIAELTQENISLKKLINDLTKGQIEVRDQIAQSIYIQLYKETPTAKDAAKDAFEAADVFLRVREDELSVVNDLRAFVQSHPNDSELGRKIRSLFGSRINKLDTNEKNS